MQVKLKPCPFCGGEVQLSEAMESIDEFTIKVYCPYCGMNFEHTQSFAYSTSARIRLCPNFVNVWNRRVENSAN